MKQCSKCAELKPLIEFYRHKASRDGRRPDCKACLDAQHKEYVRRPETRALKRAYHKKYNANLTDEQRKKYAATVARWHRRTPRHALSLSRYNALKRRPTPNPITLAELLALFQAQEGRCALSGLPMTWQEGRILPTSISLDRIDNNLGYIASNIRLVCYSVNAFRNIMSDDEMFNMALAIVANMKKPKLRIVA